MGLKICLVGAGSHSFGPATIRDVLLSDALNEEALHLCLMDIAPDNLDERLEYAQSVAQKLARRPKVSVTTRLDEALRDADFVVTAIDLARFRHWAQDFHIPRKYGFQQVFGENGGPGGIFHALRNMKPSLEIAHAMEQLCPNAWLINYSNPEHKLCQAITMLSKIKTVGLCHGVFMGRRQIAKLLEMPEHDLETAACGLNHFAWFQTIRHKQTGEDLYPALREKERKAHWLHDWDDIALGRILFRTYGLWPHPGTNHYGEYIRWAVPFQASEKLQFFYDPREGIPWETNNIPTWVYSLRSNPTETPLFPPAPLDRVVPVPPPAPEGAPEFRPSGELAVPIMEGLARGVEYDLAAVNLPNNGRLPGLPDNAVVELPATVNRDGIHPQAMCPLGEGILALLRTQVSINKLLVEALAEQSRLKLLQAVLLDPVVDSYHQAVAMIDEMCQVQQNVLPPLHW